MPALNTAYSVGVHLYRSINPGAVLSTVKVYCDGTLMTTRTRSLNTEKSLWVVGTVTFPSNGPCRFQAVDTVLAGVPALARDLKP